MSVALTTYNGERFLGAQLASIAAQQRLPDELVVVDDGSTDATVAIVEDFADSVPFRVRLERNRTTLGWRDNFFKAMSLCRCDLIALCDQDDVWHPGKLARCVAVLESRPDLALVVHAGRVTTEDLGRTRKRWPRIRRTRVLAPDRVPMGFGYYGMAMVFPRWLLKAVDPVQRPPRLASEDQQFMNHDMWLCLVAPTAGSVALLADELVLYRRHRATVSNLRPPPLGGTTGWRGLFDAPIKEPGYEALAIRRWQTATYLEGLGARDMLLPSGQVGFRVRRQARYHQHAARTFEGRAKVIRTESSRVRRVGALSRLILRGGYGRRSRGGIGATRIPLDLAVALLTRRERAGATARDEPERSSEGRDPLGL